MVFLSGFALMVLLAVLLFAASATPRRSALSIFELQRRQAAGNHAAGDELRRLSATDDIISLIRVAELAALVLFTVVAFMQWGVIGVCVSLGVALLYRRIARVELVRVNFQRLYDENDARLVQFVEKHPQLGRIFGGLANDDDRQVFGSREELEHMIDESTAILTLDEKKLIKSSLHFAEKLVESAMTPRGVIEAVAASEVLGPIVLDQLHRTGHSRFPVMEDDIDHIVGILHVRELLALAHKTSRTARESMEQKVYYIHQSQTLQHALAAFLSTRHHLFVVVNEYRETAGVITLEDCIEALIGRRIVDEFDEHDDLRAVAARHAKHNNDTPHATSV